MYIWFYETPSGFDNMVMTSDGKYLTALVFQNSNDIEKIEKNAKKIYILKAKYLILYLHIN